VKLLIVIPVIGMVLLAISAYREIPNSSDKQIFIQPLNELANPALPYPASSNNKPTKVRTKNKIMQSSSKIYSETLVPPPPPPPHGNSAEKLSKEPVGFSDKTEENGEENPFVVVEEMPMFPGGDVELLKFIGSNTVYPEVAKANNIKGRVIVRFCVTSKGDISQISVLKGVDPELDAEATRVVNALPQFIPGKQGGIAVPVWYMVPITFTLN
jgi:TonB family protein